MKNRKPRSLWLPLFFSAPLIVSSPGLAQDPPVFDSLEKMVASDEKGRPTYRPFPVEKEFRNPWPEKWEEEFQKRARAIIAAQSEGRLQRGNTYFENEKRGYGFMMAQALGTHGMAAIEALQGEDAQHTEWHRETAGIDYYAAFTLKHQMRKYYYFGGALDPDYRKRMYEGAKKWTGQDPMRRPHYTYKKPKEGWGPDAKNSWVDIRSTENLYLMRVTSVYLMAEETGNRKTAEKYKSQILDYTTTLYRIGIGEWDSENYHGHSLGPLLNLYDFAEDPDVKLAAKACLDWFFAAGAVKYWRGAFTGPTQRDYNHAQPFGGSAAAMLWVAFGDSPKSNSHWESDEVHLITSAYRPPEAIVNLARKSFQRPVTVYASKPPYSATTSYDSESRPESLETQHIAHTFQMGSLTGGTGRKDINGFKIMAWDKQVGAVTLQAVPGPDPAYVGSPMYKEGKMAGENRVAQWDSVAIWLVENGKSPWLWVIPEEIEVTEKSGITFFSCDQTWIAIRPVGTTAFEVDPALSRQINEGKKPRFPGHKVIAASGKGSGNYCGMIVEVGERQSFLSFKEFQKAVLSSKISEQNLEEGIIRYSSAKEDRLGFHWQRNALDLGIWKNGERRNLNELANWLYFPEGGQAIPLRSRWGDGLLEVEAGGSKFSCRVDENGNVKFSHQP